VAGRLVRTLAAGRLPAGPHAVRWDGRDDRGRGAASGTYVARLEVDGVPLARSMTLLR
jgi:flagellar hook assembly protein FlgD